MRGVARRSTVFRIFAQALPMAVRHNHGLPAGRATLRVRGRMLRAAHDLAEILRVDQAFALHLLEDLAPTGLVLARRNLVEAQRGRTLRRRLLRLEQRTHDLLVTGRQALKAVGWRGSRRGLSLSQSWCCQRSSRNECHEMKFDLRHLALLTRGGLG